MKNQGVITNELPMMLQHIRSFRLWLRPYLPPPLVLAMRSIDVYFEDVTPEASTLIFLTAILGWLIIYLIRKILSIVGNQSSFKDENDVLGAISSSTKSNERIVGTVVLCGPSNSGKTVLFHALCCDPLLKNMDDDAAAKLLSKIPMATVTSIQAADSLIPVSDRNGDKIRLLDYPGHVSLRSSLPKALEKASRIVLVLDASKPVADAADILFMLLTNPSFPWNSIKPRDSPNRMQVLVACHKSDLTLAKNSKRIKIQLRTELDRLRKIQRSNTSNVVDNDSSQPIVLGIPGKTLDLDNKNGDLSCDLSFVEVSCNSKSNNANMGGADGGEEWKDVRDFVQNVGN